MLFNVSDKSYFIAVICFVCSFIDRLRNLLTDQMVLTTTEAEGKCVGPIKLVYSVIFHVPRR